MRARRVWSAIGSTFVSRTAGRQNYETRALAWGEVKGERFAELKKIAANYDTIRKLQASIRTRDRGGAVGRSAGVRFSRQMSTSLAERLAPPAGRRRHFLNSGWGWCGRRGADSMVWSAAPGERSEVRGRLRYHPDRNSTELVGVSLYGAHVSRARARGAALMALAARARGWRATAPRFKQLR